MQKILYCLFIALLLTACNQTKRVDENQTPPITNDPERIEQNTQKNIEEKDLESSSTKNINHTTSGYILQNEIWRDEIHLTGDIFLGYGTILTIEPGTTVYLKSNSDDQLSGVAYEDEYTISHNDPVRTTEWSQSAILIDGRNGKIIAIGTQEKPILFRPEGYNTSSGQWDGIYIENGSIKYATLLYGGRTAIQILGNANEPVEISFNQVRFFHWAGIDIHAKNVHVHHNITEGGGHHGIGVVNDNALVEHNLILNAQTGINMHGQHNGIIRNNLIIDCTNGVALMGKNTTVINNTIVRVKPSLEGWSYQNTVIYQPFPQGAGIVGSPKGPEIIINNIIYGPFEWAFAYHDGPAVNGARIENNLYWNTKHLFGGSGDSQISPNNIMSDPLFVDPEQGDFHIKSESPAIGAGAPDYLDENGLPLDIGQSNNPDQ